VYELEPIFGAAAGAEEEVDAVGAAVVDDAADDSNTVCVVCLTEPRDTLVMPCRHMCLCSGCAESVSRQGTCPICRTRIEGLLKSGNRTPPPTH